MKRRKTPEILGMLVKPRAMTPFMTRDACETEGNDPIYGMLVKPRAMTPFTRDACETEGNDPIYGMLVKPRAMTPFMTPFIGLLVFCCGIDHMDKRTMARSSVFTSASQKTDVSAAPMKPNRAVLQKRFDAAEIPQPTPEIRSTSGTSPSKPIFAASLPVAQPDPNSLA